MPEKNLAEIGVIGGTGLYAIDGLTDMREIEVNTPFGKPSDNLIYGKLDGIPVIFLPRHGRKHAFLPGEINQRANMWALKSVGVRKIISASAVGSLKEEIAPTHFCIPDQFVDETKGRVSTFFGNGIVGHVPMAHPFCTEIQKMMYEEAKKLGITVHYGGTYCCMEGPQFSTRAESEMHRHLGYSVIGMTMATEAKLAREAGFHYAPISMITDYDAWKDEEEVSQELVSKRMETNTHNMRNLLIKIIPLLNGIKCKDGCEHFIKGCLLTHKENFPKETYEKLKLILE